MVKYLASFINNKKLCKRGTFKVKLKDEIEYFKRKFPDVKPVILFDYMGCLEMFNNNNFEVICAGRQTECVRRARLIFDKLKNEFGCDLIFYVDGLFTERKLPFWSKKVEDKYKKQIESIDQIKNGEDLNNIQIPHKIITSYNHNLFLLIKEYGKLVITIENECDFDIGEYTMKNKVCGIFTPDTDFLIMSGDWPIWSPKDFDISDFSTTKWNKLALRTSLNLIPRQMPIFATFVGNDIMSFEIIEPFMLDITKGKKDFFAVAKYIKDKYPKGFISPEEIRSLSKKIFSLHQGKTNDFFEQEADIEKRIFESLNFYNCKKSKTHREEPQWIKDHVNKTNYTILFSLYQRRAPIPIRQNYIDLRKTDVKMFSELVSVIICRMLGIVFCDKNDKDITREIVCKESHDEPFKKKTITPIFPPSDSFETIPNISRLIEANERVKKVSYHEKIKILLWIVSSGNPKRSRRVNLEDWIEISNSIYFVPVLILNYLIKDYQITHDEADVVLLAIHETSTASEEKMKNLKPPVINDDRPFWIAHTFVQLSYYFKCALAICGLYNLFHQDYFDGYLFFKMYSKYFQLGDDLRTTILDPISTFRLYAK